MILAVGLVVPRQGVFQDHIVYLLVLTTPVDIVILGVSFSGQSVSQIILPQHCVCVCVYVGACMCPSVHGCLCPCICASVCVYVCKCMCTYVYSSPLSPYLTHTDAHVRTCKHDEQPICPPIACASVLDFRCSTCGITTLRAFGSEVSSLHC